MSDIALLNYKIAILEYHKERYRNMLSDNICYDICTYCEEKWYEDTLGKCACGEFYLCKDCDSNNNHNIAKCTSGSDKSNSVASDQSDSDSDSDKCNSVASDQSESESDSDKCNS